MKRRSLRILLSACLLLVLAAAPAVQATPLQRPAEALWQAPVSLMSGLLARLAAWLGWPDEGQPPARDRNLTATPEADGPPTGPVPNDGICLDPEGNRIPCAT